MRVFLRRRKRREGAKRKMPATREGRCRPEKTKWYHDSPFMKKGSDPTLHHSTQGGEYKI